MNYLTRTALIRSLPSALFAAGLILSLPGASQAEPETITFLHVNDVYEISPKGGVGGLGQLGALLKAERAAAKYTIMTLGGDLLSPSILSGMTKGSQMIELMNELGLDVVVPGNHEFDFGEALLATRVGESTFPWLGTNTLDASGKPAVGMVATHLIKTGAYTIGFFGLLTPQTDVLSSPGENISFAPVNGTGSGSDGAVRVRIEIHRHYDGVVRHLDHHVEHAHGRETNKSLTGGHGAIVWRNTHGRFLEDLFLGGPAGNNKRCPDWLHSRRQGRHHWPAPHIHRRVRRPVRAVFVTIPDVSFLGRVVGVVCHVVHDFEFLAYLERKVDYYASKR